MKRKCDIVFVVLVYRNTQDLSDFFYYNSVKNSCTVVVNSFYNEENEREFRDIALKNRADFISVPNRGYGAGNNRGIEYALEHYDFEFLIISNADVVIKKLKIDNLRKIEDAIIAPKIVTINGKLQNPCIPFKPSRAEFYLRYLFCKWNFRRAICIFYVLSRIKKCIYYLLYPLKKKIFAAHGAFVIIPYKVVKQLTPIYNEKMFLFGEENHLGYLAENNRIATIYVPDIIVKHKEDGSMKVASVDIFENERLSYIELYNTWSKNN